MTVPRHTALVAGATGAVGSALVRELAASSAWSVLALSRRPPAAPADGAEHVQVDLADGPDARAALAAHGDVSHVFYCARATHGDALVEDAGVNRALLENLLDAVEPACELAHVHLVQGGKVYGVHVGPFPTPAREDDPRVVVPNFNYEQEDLLRTRSADTRWSWSASRPNTLLHFSPSIARNLVSTLGAYAAIARELGASLDFPGTEGAYRSITQVTSTSLLTRAIAWMAGDASCADQAFNVTNGDVFRWSGLWPRIAAAFQMRCGAVRPMPLVEFMADKEPVWARVRARHGLEDLPLARVANWSFADATLRRDWDEILSTNKLRAFGFDGWADSEGAFLDILAEYRRARILPP